MSKYKQCVVCNKWKIKDKNFRITNPSRNYTSKTCITCERKKILKPTISIKRPITKGYLYVLIDTDHYEYVKVGYTINIAKRLHKYHSDRPLDTCGFIYISKLLPYVYKLEQRILCTISTYAKALPYRSEWFDAKYQDAIIKEIQKVENCTYLFPKE